MKHRPIAKKIAGSPTKIYGREGDDRFEQYAVAKCTFWKYDAEDGLAVIEIVL